MVSAYISNICNVKFLASSSVSCIVCPSCHRNSLERKNGLVSFSHLITLHHWLYTNGKSLHEFNHFEYRVENIVSDVGLTHNFSSSSSSPPIVTHATSGANPSTWSFSFASKFSGISTGKFTFFTPIFLNFSSSYFCIFSHIAYPYGFIAIHPFVSV